MQAGSVAPDGSEVDQAVGTLRALLDQETVGALALARVSASEPARAREGLRNLLGATDRTEMVEQIRPAQSMVAANPAFLAARGG
jgi:hypothetical protein